MATSQLLALLVGVATLASVSKAEYCNGFYCSNGCCGVYDDKYCCIDTYTTTRRAVSVSVSLIAGLSVGGVLLVVAIIAAIIYCRRRRMAQAGVVYQNQGQATTVVQSSNTTAQAQPGMTYPPYQPYPAYPANYGSPQGGYPQAYPPGGVSNPAGPPDYDAPQKY